MIGCDDLLLDPMVSEHTKRALSTPAPFLEAQRRRDAQRALDERHRKLEAERRRFAQEPVPHTAFDQLSGARTEEITA